MCIHRSFFVYISTTLRYQEARCQLQARSGRQGELFRPLLRYRNVRADVFGILQKVLRGGEVVGRNGPRSRATVLHICNSQDVYTQGVQTCVYTSVLCIRNSKDVYTQEVHTPSLELLNLCIHKFGGVHKSRRCTRM